MWPASAARAALWRLSERGVARNLVLGKTSHVTALALRAKAQPWFAGSPRNVRKLDRRAQGRLLVVEAEERIEASGADGAVQTRRRRVQAVGGGR